MRQAAPVSTGHNPGKADLDQREVHSQGLGMGPCGATSGLVPDSCMEDRGLGPAEWFRKEQRHVTPLCSLSRIKHLGYREEDRNLDLGGLAGTIGSLPEHSGLPQARAQGPAQT